jgi:hypothetical protein
MAEADTGVIGRPGLPPIEDIGGDVRLAPAPPKPPPEKTPSQRSAELALQLAEERVARLPEEERLRRESWARQDEATAKQSELNRRLTEEQIRDIQANRQWREQHPRPAPPTIPPPPQFHLTPPPGLFGDNSTPQGQNAPGNQWMQAMTQFGAIGSSTDRRSAITAMVAMTGMLKGWAQGEKQLFDENYKAWKDGSETIIHNYERQRDYYDDVLNDNKMSMQEKQNELALRAFEFKDTIVQELTVQGRFDQVDKLFNTRAEAIKKLADAQKAVQQTTNSAQVTPEAREAAAIWIEQGIRPATRRAGDLNAIYAAVREYGDQHGWTEEQTRTQLGRATREFGAQSRALGAFAAGPEARTVRSLNVTIQHLGVYAQAAEALGNGDIQLFNTLRNYIATQLGAAAPTDFETVKTIVADEVIKSTLGGPGALSDREALAANLRRSSSPQEFVGQIQRILQLMGGQMLGLRKQFTSTTGEGEEEFNRRLTPQTLQAIDRAEQAEQSALSGTIAGRAGLTPSTSLSAAPGAGGSDAAAREWLRNNPDDPRAPAIRRALGM